jgi:hypothetical protein
MAICVPNAKFRPKRNEARARELSDLKRENHELKKRISKLQKELSRLDCLVPETVREEIKEGRIERRIEAGKACELCGSVKPPVITENCMYILKICKDCKNLTKTPKDAVKP